MAQMHNYPMMLLVRSQRALEIFAYTKASPQPLYNAFLNAPVPPSSPQHAVLMLHEPGRLALNKHLLGFLAAEEGNLFSELS